MITIGQAADVDKSPRLRTTKQPFKKLLQLDASYRNICLTFF